MRKLIWVLLPLLASGLFIAANAATRSYIYPVQNRCTGGFGTLAYSQNVVSGNLLTVSLFTWSGSVASVTITDTVGTSFSLAKNQDNAGGNHVAIYKGAAGGSGANTITLSGATGSFNGYCIHEIYGASTTVDATAGVDNGASPVSLSLTTTVDNTYIQAAIAGFHSNNSFTVTSNTNQYLIGLVTGGDAIGVTSSVNTNTAGSNSIGFNIVNAPDNSPMAAVAFRPKAISTFYDTRTPAGMTSGAYCIPVPLANISGTITNYVMPFVGQYTWMADTPTGFAVSGNSGHDIRPYGDSGCSTTPLSYHRQGRDATNGFSVFRIVVPTASNSTTIYMKIGGTGDTADTSTTLGAADSSIIDAVLWGFPGTIDPASLGTDGITFTGTNSPSSAYLPMGAGVYMPRSSNAYFNFLADAGHSYNLSAYGFPVGSAVSSWSLWFQNAPETRTQMIANSGGYFGGWGCVLHAGGCTGATSNGARQFVKRNPNFGADFGWTTGSYDSSDPSVSQASSDYLTTDSKPHRATMIFTPAGSQLNAGTVLLRIDGVTVSATYVTGTNVPATTDGGAPNASEVNWGRAPAHGVGHVNATLGPAMVYNRALSTDEDTTYYTCELSPGSCYSFGTAVPAGGGSSSRHIPAQSY
jgi:hypothetical protein